MQNDCAEDGFTKDMMNNHRLLEFRMPGLMDSIPLRFKRLNGCGMERLTGERRRLICRITHLEKRRRDIGGLDSDERGAAKTDKSQ